MFQKDFGADAFNTGLGLNKECKNCLIAPNIQVFSCSILTNCLT